MLDLFSMSADPQPRKIIRRLAVLQLTGMSKTRLYESMAKGEFPCQVPLGARSVGWYEDEVQEWVRNRDELRKTPAAKLVGGVEPRKISQTPTACAAVVSGRARETPTDRQRRRRSPAAAGNDKFRSLVAGANGATNLERIGTTSDGREMLWDRRTGDVLLVVGHMPTDWA